MFTCYVVYNNCKADFVKIIAAFWILDHAIEFVQKRNAFGYSDSITFTIVEEDFIECLD